MGVDVLKEERDNWDCEATQKNDEAAMHTCYTENLELLKYLGQLIIVMANHKLN